MNIGKEDLLVQDFFVPKEGQSNRAHSTELDKVFGFRINEIERALLEQYRAYDHHHKTEDSKKHYEGSQTWVGLHPQVLQTPYYEILSFLRKLSQYDIRKVVDLGAGYGRVGLVLQSIFPEAQFLGHEIMKVRMEEGQRIFDLFDLNHCQLTDQDIMAEDFELPKADLYFIYDFSDPLDLKHILKKFSDIYFKERFFIIAKGEGIRSLIQLKFPQFWASHGAIHDEEWSIYSSFTDLSSQT